MRLEKLLAFAFVAMCGGVLTFSLTRGQNPPPQPSELAKPKNPTAPLEPAATLPGRELSKLSPLQQQMYLAAQRGADWLYRSNRPDGRFEYGFLPALKTKLEGDHFLRQAGAVFALARAAKFTGDERHAAVARQALLTLLLETSSTDVPGAKLLMRHTTLPSVAVNRLAAAGLLVLAINELPQPAGDLLEQSEELCNYIGRQLQADGSLCYWDNPADPQPNSDPDGINYYPGEALYALMRSQQHRPAEWKKDVVRKSLAYYRPWWRKNKSMAFVTWQTAACSEAYLATKEQAFADFVFEMSDWLCDLQYKSLDPRHPLWTGGFMSWVDGKPAMAAPTINSASYAEGLVEACRTARQAADPQRHQKYKEAVQRSLQFAATLQYTEANTQHFADWYRPRLVGGFHASHQDGNLRIDYNQHAVSTMVQYLTYVTD